MRVCAVVAPDSLWPDVQATLSVANASQAESAKARVTTRLKLQPNGRLAGARNQRRSGGMFIVCSMA